MLRQIMMKPGVRALTSENAIVCKTLSRSPSPCLHLLFNKKKVFGGGTTTETEMLLHVEMHIYYALPLMQ